MVWPRWALGNHRKVPSSSSSPFPIRFRPPRRRPSAPALFWLHPATRLLWHIHRSSSALFCLLMALNMLAGVRPFSAQNNENNNILEEELKKNMVSTDNETVSSAEEDELTREILTLFDYEDRWLMNARKSVRNVENQTTTANESYPIPSPIDQYIQFNTDQEAENGTSSHPINGNGIDQKLPNQDQSIIDNQIVIVEAEPEKELIKSIEHSDAKNSTLSLLTRMFLETNSTAALPYDDDNTMASVTEKSSTMGSTESVSNDNSSFTTNSTQFYETVHTEAPYQNEEKETGAVNWNGTGGVENGVKQGQNEIGELERQFTNSTISSTIAVETAAPESESLFNFSQSTVNQQTVVTTTIASSTTKDNSTNETTEVDAPTSTGRSDHQSDTESTVSTSYTLLSNISTVSENEVTNYSTISNYSSTSTSEFVISTTANSEHSNFTDIETITVSSNNNESSTSSESESGLTVSNIESSNSTSNNGNSTQFANVSTTAVVLDNEFNSTVSSRSEAKESQNTVDSVLTIGYDNVSSISTEMITSVPSTGMDSDKNGINGTKIEADQTSTTSKTEKNGTESATITEETEGASGIEEMNKVVEERVLKKMLEELKSRVERRLGLGAAELIELTEYRKHLKQMLASVETALTKMPNGGRAAQHSDFPKSRRLITISSSMPDRNSELFIARKNAISESVLPPPSNGEEIRKSPPKGLSDPTGVDTPSPTPKGITTTMTSSTQQTKQQVQTVSEPTTAATAKITVQESWREPSSTTTPGTNNNQSKSNYSTIQTPSVEERTAAPTPTTTPPMEQLVPNAAPASSSVEQGSNSGGESDEQSVMNNPRKSGFFRAESFGSKYFPFVVPFRNNTATAEQCKHLSQEELVKELKYKGNYNPDLMAWDVSGVFRFLDKTITDQYERQFKPPKSSEQAVKRNVEALERLLAELNLRCDVRSPEVLSRMANLTMAEPKRSIISPTLRHRASLDSGIGQVRDQLMRYKRNSVLAEQLVHQTLNSSQQQQGTTHQQQQPIPPVRNKSKNQKMIGDVHVVPFGCDKRGGSEDGYLRLCGACQAIRKLPDEYFPPFINEVMCDEDKACLYFYDYPHGKCKQKHMNFVVLRNVGTQVCQIWEKFNLNVRVSCECFVDEMSFFSKYV